MSTLLLSRADVARCLHATSLIESLRDALRRGAGERPEVPVRTVRQRAPGELGGTLLHAYDVPGGRLLALLEATRLLEVQRALVGALAAGALASPQARRVGLIGAGAAASLQLKQLRLVRSLAQVRVYDRSPEQAHLLARRLYDGLKLPAQPAGSPEEAVSDADIVILEEGEPTVLQPGMVREGAHVQALVPGASLPARLLQQSRSFHDGEPGASTLPGTPIGEVLRGERTGRPQDGTVTLFVSSDPSSLDTVTAWDVLQAALPDEALTRFDFAQA